MKISYHDPRPTQPPVSAAQEEMRQTRPRGLPVLRAFFMIMLLGILALVATKAWLHARFFAYGIVACRTDEIRTPWPAAVRGLRLRPGDRIRRGEMLCQLVPLEAESQARAIRSWLTEFDPDSARRDEPGQADNPEHSGVTPAAAPASPSRTPPAAMSAAEREYSEALARLEATQAEYDQAAQRRRYDREKAAIEYRKLQTHYSARQQRYERVLKLKQLDAAVASDVETARLEMELARDSLDQAALDLKAAREAANPFKAQVALARRQLQDADARRQEERRERHAEFAAISQDLGMKLSPELPIDPAKLGLSVGNPARAPLVITAPYDGAAFEVAASDGRVLGADQPLLSLAETGQCWIDTYVAPEKCDRLQPGRRVRVYLGGGSAPRAGAIASVSGLATAVPPALAAQMPETRRAVYCRVELDPGTPLAPGQVARIVME